MQGIPIPAWTKDQVYQSFRAEVERKGLLKKTPVLHFILFLASFSLVVWGLYIASFLENTFLIALSAILIAFPRSWVGFIGHDISHGQVFSSRPVSYATGLIVWNLLTGIRMSSWERNHHPHHEHTNKIGFDPDVDNPFVFSEKQGDIDHPFARFLPKFSKYQHLYFFMMLPFIHSVRMLAVLSRASQEKKDVYFFIEFGLLLTFVVLFFSYAFYFFGLINGALFLLLNYGTTALIAGLAFAPNHKGQPMLGPDEEVTYKTQVISSRNLSPNPVIDFLYGGLNYQIEHHLFTDMSRFHFKKARILVREFCEREGLPYHETTPLGSLIEMYRSLKSHSRAGL